MHRLNLRNLIVIGLLCAASGCTHVQLRKNAVNEAMTVGDYEQQQVLDNLAMFVSNYNALPYFSFPNQTAAIVTDQGSAGVSAGWSRPVTTGSTATFKPTDFASFILSAIGLSGGAQRSAQEGFTITPINDPRKLELMRCAYQLAISRCGCGEMPKNCPDCQARFNTFYTGDPEGNIRQQTPNTVTSECLKGPCWFHSGPEKCVPKECCGMVGHYCDVCVWVPPEGRDELTKLTLAILDYATHDQPQRLTKQVVYYVDARGLPADQKDAVGTITAQVAINERNESVLNTSPADELRIEQIVEGQLKIAQQRFAQAKEMHFERKQFLEQIHATPSRSSCS